MRLHLLLTVKESAINVPMNLEARRRITFFANSLYMRMPNAPVVRNMLSFRSVIFRSFTYLTVIFALGTSCNYCLLTCVNFSVLTPYYTEDVLYSEEELHKENEDGISILFYLQKIYPGDY